MTADKGKIFWKCCNWCINKLVLRNKPWCDPTHLHSVVSWIHDDQRWSLHRSAPHRPRDTEVQLMLLPQLWTSLSLCPCTHYRIPNNQKCGSLSLLHKIIIFILPKVVPALEIVWWPNDESSHNVSNNNVCQNKS